MERMMDLMNQLTACMNENIEQEKRKTEALVVLKEHTRMQEAFLRKIKEKLSKMEQENKALLKQNKKLEASIKKVIEVSRDMVIVIEYEEKEKRLENVEAELKSTKDQNQFLKESLKMSELKKTLATVQLQVAQDKIEAILLVLQGRM